MNIVELKIEIKLGNSFWRTLFIPLCIVLHSLIILILFVSTTMKICLCIYLSRMFFFLLVILEFSKRYTWKCYKRNHGEYMYSLASKAHSSLFIKFWTHPKIKLWKTSINIGEQDCCNAKSIRRSWSLSGTFIWPNSASLSKQGSRINLEFFYEF